MDRFNPNPDIHYTIIRDTGLWEFPFLILRNDSFLCSFFPCIMESDVKNFRGNFKLRSFILETGFPSENVTYVLTITS